MLQLDQLEQVMLQSRGTKQLLERARELSNEREAQAEGAAVQEAAARCAGLQATLDEAISQV